MGVGEDVAGLMNDHPGAAATGLRNGQERDRWRNELDYPGDGLVGRAGVKANGARPPELERYPRYRLRPPVGGAGDRAEHHGHDQRRDGTGSLQSPLLGV